MDTIDRRLAAPALLAGAIALVYLIVAPPSYDLAAQLLRTKLFSAEGFGLWNNWWYGGHDTLGYSVLFPPLAAASSPQLVGALAAVITAVLFAEIVAARYGTGGRVGALWFAAASTVDLFSGRLTFALGLMFVLAALLAIQRDRPLLAGGLSLLAALSSPVAALFTALIGLTYALNRRTRPTALTGTWVLACSLVPVLALAVAFPEGGTEPYAFSALWPIPVIAVAIVALLPAEENAVKLGAVLYAAGCVLAYAIPSPIGSNAGRLGPLVAGPLAALVWWRRRTAWLLVAALPLLYIQWQPPAHDVITSAENPAVSASYWRPLLRFLSAQRRTGGVPFRIEIPFTSSHWESYYVAPHFPLARGWERQLDERDNALFYRGTLTAARYEAWLHELAVRFVAVPGTSVDSSARQELALIDHGLPYLRLVWRTPRFRVYAVRDPTPIAQGPVTLTAYGPNSLTLIAHAPGRVLLHVRYSPYWTLGEGSGCVMPAGQFTALTVRRPGRVRLVIGFSLTRIGARSPRCTAERNAY